MGYAGIHNFLGDNWGKKFGAGIMPEGALGSEIDAECIGAPEDSAISLHAKRIIRIALTRVLKAPNLTETSGFYARVKKRVEAGRWSGPRKLDAVRKH
jgi:hypothetical protein